jgi:4'-phosphopantetheinyl transferase
MSGGQSGGDAEQVDLWFAFCDAASLATAERLHRKLLSADEDERFRRFHHDRDRHAYLLAHVILRQALSSYAPIAPQEWTFSAEAFGKPRLSGPVRMPLEFNLSHTSGAVACAFARSRPVGVDVQSDAGAGKLFSLAKQVFSERETAMLKRLAEADRDRAAIRLWTLKEALAKALGVGIRLPFPQIDFRLESDRPPSFRSSLPGLDGAAWRFACFESDSGHWLSLAVPQSSGRALEVRVHEFVGPDLTPFLVELPASGGNCWRLARGQDLSNWPVCAALPHGSA